MNYESKTSKGVIRVSASDSREATARVLQRLREASPGKRVSAQHAKGVRLSRAQRFALAMQQLDWSAAETARQVGVSEVCVYRYLAKAAYEFGIDAPAERREPSEPTVRLIESLAKGI